MTPTTSWRGRLTRSAAVLTAAGALVVPVTLATPATPAAAIAHSGVSVLKPGQTLYKGQYLLSANKAYKLAMQTNGNLVLYKGRTTLWQTRTGGKSGARLIMQRDGNLVLAQGGKALWNTGTRGFEAKYLAVQNDGNLVLYNTSNQAIWWRSVKIATVKAGQRISSGMTVLSRNRAYRLTMQRDGNLVLWKWSKPIWHTGTQGAGAAALMQTDGNLVVYKGKTALWSSHTRGYNGAWLAVQDDSNVVLYKGKTPVWWRNIVLGEARATTKLSPGQALMSYNRHYKLQMQTDGNLVLVKDNKTALWSTRTGGRKGAYAMLQTDGNFVLYVGRTAIWSTKTGGRNGAWLAMQNDGNAVLYLGRTPIWSTGTGGR